MSLKSYIGDKAFYKRTLAIALPMIIQNTVNNTGNMTATNVKITSYHGAVAPKPAIVVTTVEELLNAFAK